MPLVFTIYLGNGIRWNERVCKSISLATYFSANNGEVKVNISNSNPLYN